MPRPPSTTHVLREAREKLGITQEALADTVKISVTTLKAIEACRLTPNRRLAARIGIAVRLGTEQLMDNSNPDVPKFYPKLEQQFKALIPTESALLSSGLGKMFEDCQTPTQFFVLRWMIYERLAELAAEFKVRAPRPLMRELHSGGTAARKPQPRRASPGSDNGERKSSKSSRAPSVQRSRGRA